MATDTSNGGAFEYAALVAGLASHLHMHAQKRETRVLMIKILIDFDRRIYGLGLLGLRWQGHRHHKQKHRDKGHDGMQKTVYSAFHKKS